MVTQSTPITILPYTVLPGREMKFNGVTTKPPTNTLEIYTSRKKRESQIAYAIQKGNRILVPAKGSCNDDAFQHLLDIDGSKHIAMISTRVSTQFDSNIGISPSACTECIHRKRSPGHCGSDARVQGWVGSRSGSTASENTSLKCAMRIRIKKSEAKNRKQRQRFFDVRSQTVIDPASLHACRRKRVVKCHKTKFKAIERIKQVVASQLKRGPIDTCVKRKVHQFSIETPARN